jgi:hypothetical protein
MAKQEYLLKVVLDDGELKVKIPGVINETNRMSDAFDKATESNKRYAESTRQNKKVNDDMISSAGLAGATLTEFGRTISDLPFGITAITNNLSQLSTLFVTLIAKTGGTTNAFSLLFDQLKKGPLAIILVFQVLVSLLQEFQGVVVGLFKDTDDLNEATKELTKTYDDLKTKIEENNKAIIQQDEEFNKLVDRLLDMRGTVELVQQGFGEKSEFYESFVALREEIEEALGYAIDFTDPNMWSKLREATPFLKKAADDIIDLRKRIETGRITGDLSPLELANLQLDLYIKEQEAFGVAAEVYLNSVEYAKLLARIQKAKQDAAKKILEEDIEFATFLNAKDIAMSFAEAFEGYFNEFKDPLIADENLIDADIFIEEFRKFEKIRKEISKKTDIEILNDQEKAILKRIDNLSEEVKAIIDVEKLKEDVAVFFSDKRLEIVQKEFDRNLDQINRKLKEQREKLHNEIREAQEMLGGLQDVMNMFTDAELSREERKTVMLNNQLAERLKNEKLSAEERARINAQIEANEEKLQKKRDEIAERNFKLQKAFAIAQASINTALAISDVLAREPGGLIKKGVAAAIIGALGAAQIAAILSTKFVPTASSVPSGQAGSIGAGAAGSDRQDPIFNIVGTGQQFQLSQAIAQRTGEPVRAYVVTSDVRSGISLERNIIKGSKLG